jgi:hypothetical protein
MAGIKAKQAAKAANDLSQAMTEPERQKRLPQNQRDPRNQAAKDILENLPRFLKNAKSLSEAPNKEAFDKVYANLKTMPENKIIPL